MTQFLPEKSTQSEVIHFDFSFYHFGLFLFDGAQTLPPAHHATLRLHQAAANVMETLLLLGGPEQNKCGCQINLFWQIINIL